MQQKKLTTIALMTATICILAPISIPVPLFPVALTLCTFALYLTAYLLPWKEAVAATGLYLLIGSIGIPVFSGYQAGVGRFAAAGGGYMVGYLFLTGIASYFVHRYPDTTWLQILGMVLGTIVLYTLGTFWMAHVIGQTFLATLPAGALIFLPMDAVKIGISCCIGQKVSRYVYRAVSC